MTEPAALPLNLTDGVPVKPDPAITTFVPTGPAAGENEAIAGPPVTVKFVAVVAVPPGAVTEILPVVAPAGTDVVIRVAEVTVKAALVPLNATAVAPVKLVPVITTLCPTAPCGGVKPPMEGTDVAE